MCRGGQQRQGSLCRRGAMGRAEHARHGGHYRQDSMRHGHRGCGVGPSGSGPCVRRTGCCKQSRYRSRDGRRGLQGAEEWSWGGSRCGRRCRGWNWDWGRGGSLQLCWQGPQRCRGCCSKRVQGPVWLGEGDVLAVSWAGMDQVCDLAGDDGWKAGSSVAVRRAAGGRPP